MGTEVTTEAVIQNYNHPSICFWGISNEILIGGISEKLVENHKELNALAKEPDIYVLPEVNERREGVANWFETMGEMDLKAPMEFPEGKWNVKYAMEEFASCPEALEIVSKAVKLASNFDLRPGTGMWDMMKSVTPEEILSMTGNMMPEGFLESLNAQLITIDKK